VKLSLAVAEMTLKGVKTTSMREELNFDFPLFFSMKPMIFSVKPFLGSTKPLFFSRIITYYGRSNTKNKEM
jgi:hypothetical protein